VTESTGSTVTRTFAASPEDVFDAWVTPAAFAVWWGGSAVAVPLDSVEMDARPEGKWKATMILGNDSPDIHWYGEFREVDRPSRLVMTLADRPGEAREIVTVIFTAVDGGTQMRFGQTGGNLSAEEYERTAAGWQTFFDAMGTLFAA